MYDLLIQAQLPLVRDGGAALDLVGANLTANASNIITTRQLLIRNIFQLLLSYRNIINHDFTNAIVIPFPWHSLLQFLTLRILTFLYRLLQRNA